MLVLGQFIASALIVVLFVIGNVTTLIYLVKYWPKFSAFTAVAAVLEALINGKSGIYAHAGAHHYCPWIMSAPKGWNGSENLLWAWSYPNLCFFSLFALLYSSLSSIFSLRAAVILLRAPSKGLSFSKLFIV